MLIKRLPWLTQPQKFVKLRRAFAGYLNACRLWSLPGNLPVEAGEVAGGFAKTGTVTTLPNIGGVGVKGDGTTGYYDRTIAIVAQPHWLACSFICGVVNTTDKSSYSLGGALAFDAYSSIHRGDGAASSTIHATFRAVTSANLIRKKGPFPTANRKYNVVAVYPDNLKASAYLYVNGLKYTTDGVSSLDLSYVGATTLVHETVGATVRDVAGKFADDIVLFTANGLGLIPESLAREISVNPYILLEPKRSLQVSQFVAVPEVPVVVAPSGGGGYWVDLPTGRRREEIADKSTKTVEKLTEKIDGLIEEALTEELTLEKYSSDTNKLSNKQRAQVDQIKLKVADILQRLEEAKLQRYRLNYYLLAALALLL